MGSATERVEVVDVDGRVIDVVSREEMRRRNLRHRSTYVVVFRPEGGLVVHQRAGWKDVYPRYWDLAFGGVCGVGESWIASARRELAEEAGITEVELHDLGGGRYDASDGHIVARLFWCNTDQEVTSPDGEVVAVDEIALSELESWLADRRVCPDSHRLLVDRLLAGNHAF